MKNEKLNKLYLTVLNVLFLLVGVLGSGQEVKILTDKEIYKFDEKIEVKIEINIEVDSVELIDYPNFSHFKMIEGPKKSNKISSMLNEETAFIYKRTYILRPEKLGKLKIVSPTFYSKGKKIESIEKYVEITDSELNEEELHEFKFNNFVEDNIKPNGTFLLFFNDEFGYIKIVEGKRTVFYRKLTKEELEILKNIK